VPIQPLAAASFWVGRVSSLPSVAKVGRGPGSRWVPSPIATRYWLDIVVSLAAAISCGVICQAQNIGKLVAISLTSRLPAFFISRWCAIVSGRIAALNRHVERVFDPSRKDTHWGKRKLKRDL
jgi:hypothetical protein